MATMTFTVEGEPIAAPRMTQRDKWLNRPCVLRYFAWKAKAIEAAGRLPAPEQIESLSWVAVFAPPVSWSAKRRAAANGTLHRSKPDRDNVDKAVLDSLFKSDQAIAKGTIEKRWGCPERLEVTIEFRETP